MIFLLLFIDVFFYTYTSWSTCFFLLFFLSRKKSLFFFLVWISLWDIFLLHTRGFFLILCVLLFFLSYFFKGGLSCQNIFVRFFLLSFFFLFLLFLTNHLWTIYIGGICLDFLFLFFGAKKLV